MNPAPPVTTIRMCPASGPLSRPGARRHGPQGAQEDLHVEPQRPGVDVFEVHADPLVEIGDPVPAADLPEARDARTHAQLALVPQLVALELVRKRGARSDQAHVPLEDAPELRQLVQAVFPTNP